MSNHWAILVKYNNKNNITSILQYNNKTYFSGQTAVPEKVGFIGCIENTELDWSIIINGVNRVHAITTQNKHIVACGDKFIGKLDPQKREFTWTRGAKTILRDISCDNNYCTICGENGTIVKLSKETTIEKKLYIKTKTGEKPPQLYTTCLKKHKTIVAGICTKLFGKGSECFIGVLDKELNPIWCAAIGGPRSDGFKSICTIGKNIYACGWTENPDSGESSILVACFNQENGTLKWCNTYSGKRSEKALKIITNGKHLHVTGTTNSPGKTSGFLLTLNKENGETIDAKTFTINKGKLTLNTAYLTPQGILLAGKTSPNPYTSTGLIIHYPQNHTGNITIGDKQITIQKWTPKQTQWWPNESTLNPLTHKEKITYIKTFNTTTWYPRTRIGKEEDTLIY